MVTQDPPGAKIGNGGATMHVLECLKEQLTEKDLIKGKVFHLLLVIFQPGH